MSEPKTVPTDASVDDFIAGIPNPVRREDARAVLALMKSVTRQKPRMWGPSIVGFGKYRYKYASGREGDWPLACFSPRSAAMTVYLMPPMARYEDLLAKLGPHKTGQSCLYIRKLADVDVDVLRALVRAAYQHAKQTHR